MDANLLKPHTPKPRVSSLFDDYVNNPEWDKILPPTFLEVAQDYLDEPPAIKSREVGMDEMVSLFTQSLEDVKSSKTTSRVATLKVGVLISHFQTTQSNTTDPKEACGKASKSILEILGIPSLYWAQCGVEYLRFAPWQQAKYVRDGKELESYTFRSHYHHMGMAWITFPTIKTTIALIHTANYNARYEVKTIVEQLQAGNLPYQHPLLLPLIANQVMTTSWSWSLRRYSWAITKCQMQTGYHKWGSVPRTELDFEQIDISGITRDIVTASAMLTSTMALMTSNITWARQLSEDNEWLARTGHYDSKCIEYARVEAQGSERRNEFLADQCKATHQNATSIMQGLFNLIAQRDQSINISLARDSRKLAASSKRDSTSMKAIAAVTMFFLPGTFVASIFATPFLDANTGPFDSAKLFWVYWIITIFLTIITISAWFWWIRRTDRKELEETKDMENGNIPTGEHAEKNLQTKEEKMKTG